MFNTLNEKNVVFQSVLMPSIWNVDETIKSNIKRKLYRLALDIFKSLRYPNVELTDVYIVGSSANYNYTKYSDIDLHLIFDFSQINSDVRLVKSMLDYKKWRWNYVHSPLIGNNEIEIYFQDINEFHVSSGVYSLKQDKWINRPIKISAEVDEDLVLLKAGDYKKQIDFLERKKMDVEEKYEMFNKIKNDIIDLRKVGLSTGGEFSVENLTFKELRNSGYISKITNLINKSYDMIYSEI